MAGDLEKRNARTEADGHGETVVDARCPTHNAKPGHAPLPAPLRRMALRFAKEIRDEHGLLDRPTADRFVRLLRTSVVPRRKPGRATSRDVLQAAELREEHTPWCKIYGQLIPGYWKLTYPERFWRSTHLRDTVRAHLRRRAK